LARYFSRHEEALLHAWSGARSNHAGADACTLRCLFELADRAKLLPKPEILRLEVDDGDVIAYLHGGAFGRREWEFLIRLQRGTRLAVETRDADRIETAGKRRADKNAAAWAARMQKMTLRKAEHDG
jgi:hypothetical protein